LNYVYFDDAVAFAKNGTGERMRITTTGAVSFGATGTNYGSSGQVLTSQGDAPPIWAAVSGIPVGGIIMWSGSVASIPAGWALCNGANGTPNLLDRFIVGAGSGYNPGNTGGSKDAIVVTHSHTATVTDPSHSHTYGTSSSGVQGNPANPNPFGAGPAYYTSTAFTGITVSNSTEGSSGTNANLPPYYALAYIMKT
jgi:hypothetical protein